MSNRFPNILKSDGDVKKQGRGSIDDKMSKDTKTINLKWMDNRSITIASTKFVAEHVSTIKCYSKPDKRYIDVTRPNVITYK